MKVSFSCLWHNFCFWLILSVRYCSALYSTLFCNFSLRFVEETTLPWYQGMFDSQRADFEYFKMLSSCNQLLLRTSILHLQRLCISMSDAANTGSGEVLIACNHVCRLFDVDPKSTNNIAGEVLRLFYIMIVLGEKVCISLTSPLYSVCTQQYCVEHI